MKTSFFVLAALFAATQAASLKQMMLAQVESKDCGCGCSSPLDDFLQDALAGVDTANYETVGDFIADLQAAYSALGVSTDGWTQDDKDTLAGLEAALDTACNEADAIAAAQALYDFLNPCSVKCPVVPVVSCDGLTKYVLNETTVEGSDNGGLGNYGDTTPGQAVLSGQYNSAASSQGAYQKAIPDILKKTNKVENGNKETQAKDQEDFSGTRTKTFTICGEITINEHQCGGICKAESTCEANTGEQVCESITRVGDADATVEPVGSQSGPATYECPEAPGCGCPN